MQLAKSAMLVSVTIINGGLLGERRDSKASELVENSFNVSHRRTKASKYLIDRKHKSVKRVIAASQRVREVVYRFTLPWGDDKLRLLPVKTAEQFRYAISNATTELEDARTEYIRNYPALVAQSEQDLAELFDATQYPGKDEIGALFKTKINYWPMPESGHFMADISESAAKEAKQAIEAEIEERLIEATYDMVRRAKDVVTSFLDKLESTDTEPTTNNWGDVTGHKIQGVLRDSLIDNITDTANLIEKMNLTESSQIKKVVKDLRRLSGYSADVWRRVPMRYQIDRPKAITAAQEILTNLQMLDMRDQEIESMVSDASDYM